MFKTCRIGLLAAMMLAATSLLSACSNSNETKVEGSVSMHFDLGGSRTFFPNIIVDTENVAYLLFPVEESYIERDGNKTKWFESKFVVSVSHQYQAKGEIVTQEIASESEWFKLLPKTIPAEWEGKPLKILKLDTLVELSAE